MASYCQIYQPAVAAHRGASRRYPENTLAALKEAINIAMQNPEVRFFIETDVRASKDGTPVLMHDSSVARTTKGKGFVEELSLLELQTLPMKSLAEILGGTPHSTHAPCKPFLSISKDDVRVPTLEELFTLIDQANEVRSQTGSPIGLALEVKPVPPTKWLSRQMRFLAGVTSGLLDLIGLKGWAEKMMPPTPSIDGLAQTLNQHVECDHPAPLILFSSAAAIGRRDLQQLWSKLTPHAKENLSHDNSLEAIRFNAPRHLLFTDLDQSKHTLNLIQRATETVRSFWVAGSLRPQTETAKTLSPNGVPIRTHFVPLDTPESIRTSLQEGATLITSNYPERVVEALAECYGIPHDETCRTPALAQQQDIKHDISTRFEEKEMQRRQYAASDTPELRV